MRSGNASRSDKDIEESKGKGGSDIEGEANFQISAGSLEQNAVVPPKRRVVDV